MSANAQGVAGLPARLDEPGFGAPKSRGPMSGLTAPQKAALIIAALGPDVAGPIIERIDEKHMRAFAQAYARLQKVPRESLLNVVQEFVGHFATDEEGEEIRGGVEQTRELLGHFVSEEDIVKLMEDVDGPDGGSVWEKLERADDVALGAYLAAQNPQIAAVVLSRMGTEKASTVLDQMEADAASEIILRLSRPLEVNPEALQILSERIRRDFLEPMRKKASKHNPGEMIGSMMNNIMSEKRDTLLAFLAKNAPDIVGDVRKAMLTFQDITERVPPKAIPLAIKAVELEDFLQAVKLGRENAPSTVEFIFANISQRMAQQYEEQIEGLKQITVKEGEAAQARFMTAIRTLAKNGEIVLNDIPDEDEEAESEGGDTD